MGCDGGTIPRRDELVKTKQKKEQKDANAENAFKWKHCAITQEHLKEPIVACELGRLYNKEGVIQYLLNKNEFPTDVAKHIKSLKDVVTLVLTPNPAFKATSTKGNEYVDTATSEYICASTGVEMNGKYKFVFNRTCGCVFSERAMKNIKSEKCLSCAKPMSMDDLITLNPSDEERQDMEIKMNERRLAAKLAKKRSKEVKEEIKEEPGVSAKKVKLEKVEKEEAGSSKSVGAAKLLLPEKAKGSYSIAKDPKASEALKSLFTSHDTAKQKPKAHWVTHNPLFY